MRRWFNLIANRFDRAISIIADAGFYFAAALTLVMTLMVFVEAVLRYGRVPRINVADEFSGYMLAAVLFLSLATVLRRGKHLRVTFLVERLPSKIQNIVAQLQPVMLMFMLTIIIFPIWNLFAKSWKIQATSVSQVQTPQWIPQILVVIGIFIFWLQALAQVIQNIRGGSQQVLGAERQDTLSGESE